MAQYFNFKFELKCNIFRFINFRNFKLFFSSMITNPLFISTVPFHNQPKLYGTVPKAGLFRYFPPADYLPPPPPPVEAVAAATSLFTEYVFCESVDSAHNSQISSIFQEADCLLKLVKVNK